MSDQKPPDLSWADRSETIMNEGLREWDRKMNLFESIPGGELKDTGFKGGKGESEEYGILSNGDVIVKKIKGNPFYDKLDPFGKEDPFIVLYKQYTGEEAKKYLAERLKT